MKNINTGSLCISVPNPALIILTGFLIGILSGMFGFGGSSISTPLLRILFLIPPYYALASPLPMTLLSAILASARYHRENLVDWEIVIKILIPMVPGSIIGAYLTKYISGKSLMLFTAIFLLYIALRFILSERERQEETKRKWLLYLLGFFVGFLSGLLANGGGIFIVPLLSLMGVRLKKAIASSLVIVILGVLPSVIVHAYLGHIDWPLTLFLSLGAIPAAYLGAHITLRISQKKLRVLYGSFLLIFSLYFALFELLG